MQQEQGEAEPEAFGILPENWEAAQAFFACATQWYRDRAGTLSGLRYSALQLVIQHYQCADPDDAFRRAQVMETAVVEQSRRMSPKS